MTRRTSRSDAEVPDVGQRLSAARLRRGLTQSEVARRAGLAAPYLSRIENGRVQPAFRTVLLIARVLGADLVEIVGGPSTSGTHQGHCPVTRRGRCLLDMIGPEKQEGVFTPQEIRLMRRFASWIEGAEPSRLRAMEILLEDLAP